MNSSISITIEELMKLDKISRSKTPDSDNRATSNFYTFANINIKANFLDNIIGIPLSMASNPTLEPVISETIEKLNYYLKLEPNQSQLALSIDDYSDTEFLFSLLIINNSDNKIVFNSLPFKILNSHDDVIFNSSLNSDNYQAAPKTYSVYKIKIKKTRDIILPNEGYSIIFG